MSSGTDAPAPDGTPENDKHASEAPEQSQNQAAFPWNSAMEGQSRLPEAPSPTDQEQPTEAPDQVSDAAMPWNEVAQQSFLDDKNGNPTPTATERPSTNHSGAPLDRDPLPGHLASSVPLSATDSPGAPGGGKQAAPVHELAGMDQPAWQETTARPREEWADSAIAEWESLQETPREQTEFPDVTTTALKAAFNNVTRTIATAVNSFSGLAERAAQGDQTARQVVQDLERDLTIDYDTPVEKDLGLTIERGLDYVDLVHSGMGLVKAGLRRLAAGAAAFGEEVSLEAADAGARTAARRVTGPENIELAGRRQTPAGRNNLGVGGSARADTPADVPRVRNDVTEPTFVTDDRARLHADRRFAGDGIERVETGFRPGTDQLQVTVHLEVRPTIPRSHLEDTIATPRDVGLPGYDRAHLIGRVLGSELAAGTMYTTVQVNRSIQATLETQLKTLRSRLQPDQRLLLRARSTAHSPNSVGDAVRHGGLRDARDRVLKRAEYDFAIVDQHGTPLDRHGIVIETGLPPNPGPPDIRAVPGGLGRWR